MIRAFDATATTFTTNGNKNITAIKATIHCEDNGDYYAEIEAALDYQTWLQEGNILAIDTKWAGRQAFRCSNPKLSGSRVKVKAWHIFYDSADLLLLDSRAVDLNANAAINHFNDDTDRTSPFTVSGNIANTHSLYIVRKTLEQAISEMLELWQGHLYRDNWTIGIRESVGTDNGISVAYGKNLIGWSVDEDWDNVCTKLLPVGKDGTLLDTVYVTASGVSYDKTYARVETFQQDLERNAYADDAAYLAALKSDLQTQAQAYIDKNKTPQINYTITTHIPDGRIDIGDTISVTGHPKYPLSLQTNVLSFDYDCIAEKYTKLEFGNFKQKNLKGLLSKTQNIANNAAREQSDVVKVWLESDLEAMTEQILGQFGSSYVIYDGNQIMVVDALPPSAATKCMRINAAGFGMSNTGINGTFNSVFTIDGKLDLQQLNVLNLTASLIKGGTLKLGGFNNENGVIEICDATGNVTGWINLNGIYVYSASSGSSVKISAEDGFELYDRNGELAFWQNDKETHTKKLYAEEEIDACGLAKIVGVTIRDDDENIVNQGIAFVGLV